MNNEHGRPVLPERQHGFLPGRSFATNLATMLHTAWSNIAAGSQTDVIYTDYSSAFQSVNHNLLLHKLKQSFHISDKAFDWCESYLSGRRQRVVVKGKCSNWVPAPSGTPEGGILSPLLFACFINDSPTSTLMFAEGGLRITPSGGGGGHIMPPSISAPMRASATKFGDYLGPY